MNPSEIKIVSGNNLLKYKPSIIQLFVDTFSAPPRNEQWTEEEVSEYLAPILQFGFASIYSDNSVVLGFNTFLPIQHCYIKEDIHRLLGIYEGYYFSDAAVSLAERGKGIGTALLLQGLHHIFSHGDKPCAVRTRTDALEMRHILERRGFMQKANCISSIHGSSAERVLYLMTARDYLVSNQPG